MKIGGDPHRARHAFWESLVKGFRPVDPNEFKPGLYRHHRGEFYRALFLTRHHETREVFVVYVPYAHPESGVRSREWSSPGKDSWTDEVRPGLRRFTFVEEAP